MSPEEKRNTDRRGTEGWHVRKEVNITHIITTLSIAISVIVFAMKMDGRVTTQEIINARQDEQMKEVVVTINSSLGDIRNDIRDLRNHIIQRDARNESRRTD